MLSPITSILNKLDTSKKQLKIMTAATHEGYHSMMSNIPHEFYLIDWPGSKPYDFHTRPLPKNHYIIKCPNRAIPIGIEFDIVFSQQRYNQFQMFDQMSKNFNIPHINLQHALVPPGLNKFQQEQIKTLRADKTVFVAYAGKENWGGQPEDEVIPYGIDVETFKGWTGGADYGLTIVNQIFGRRQFCGTTLFEEIIKEIPIKLIGENPGLSQSINDPAKLASEINAATAYINTANYSTLPVSLIEAMACGCPVISTPYFEVSRYIKHGENGFLAETSKEFIDYFNQLKTDKQLSQKIGRAARQTVIENFPMEKFVDRWNNVFWDVYWKYR